MIRHQAKPKHAAWDALDALSQQLDEGLVIPWLMEDFGFAVGAVQDMTHHAAGCDSPWPSHGKKSYPAPSAIARAAAARAPDR
jgi:hypothetical protein